MFFNQYPYINQNDLNLDWIIKHFKEFIDEIASLDAWRIEHEREYHELKRLYDQFAAGDLPQSVYDAIYTWVVANMESIIAAAVKTVFFELNDDGYFVAFIPDSWDDIIFNTTGLDISVAGVDYGHLVLSY